MGINKVKMPGVCTSNREEHPEGRYRFEPRFDNFFKSGQILVTHLTHG